MRTFSLALLVLPLLALGCRSNPNEVMLEREGRMLEDKIYQLQAHLDDCCAAREATIRENEDLKKQLGDRDRGGRDSYTPPSSGSSGTSPRRSKPESEIPLEAPTIELPDPSDTPPDTAPGKSGAAVDGTPMSLVINQRLTGGMDRDGQSGDKGIFLVVEPRDENGRLVKTPGTVSVVVLDPTQNGPEARIARWDFSAEQFPSHFQTAGHGRGLMLELPWPAGPPKSKDLQLFVRYTSPAGEQVNADAKIKIRAPGELAQADDAKSWSASQSLRSSSSRSVANTRRAPTRVAPQSDVARGSSEEDASPRQALRNDRPVWKPFR